MELNVWNGALRAAVGARSDPAALDDLFEDMLLAGKIFLNPTCHAIQSTESGFMWCVSGQSMTCSCSACSCQSPLLRRACAGKASSPVYSAPCLWCRRACGRAQLCRAGPRLRAGGRPAAGVRRPGPHGRVRWDVQP